MDLGRRMSAQPGLSVAQGWIIRVGRQLRSLILNQKLRSMRILESSASNYCGQEKCYVNRRKQTDRLKLYRRSVQSAQRCGYPAIHDRGLLSSRLFGKLGGYG